MGAPLVLASLSEGSWDLCPKDYIYCSDQNYSGSGKCFQELILKNYGFYCGMGPVWK